MLQGLTGSTLKWAIVLASGFEYILVGYDQGLMGGILNGEPFIRQFDLPSSTMQGVIASLYDVGSFVGSGIIAYMFGERLGRKRTIVIGEIIMLIGCILQGTSFEIVQLCIGRVVSGIGNGMNSSAIPTWQSELTSHHQRGQALVLECGILIGGVALSFWLGYATDFTDSSFQWRFPIFVQLIFIIGVLSVLPFLPETPRWLISKGRYEEAKVILARLEDTNDLENEKVVNEFEEIKSSYLHEKEISNATFMDLFKKNDKQQNLRRMLLGMMPMMMNQISGINAPSYYLPLLLQESVGLDRNLALILAACGATQYCISTFLPLFFFDKLGRRKTIIYGCIGLSASMIVIAVTNYVGTYGAGIVTTLFFYLFFDFFGMSVLPVSWCYSPEISSLQYRSRTNAISMATQWLCNFVIVMITPVGVQNLQYRFYIIWAVFNAVFVVMNYLFLVETSGHTLEEMDSIFERNPGWIVRSEEMKRVGTIRDFDEEEFGTSISTGYEKAENEHVEHSSDTPKIDNLSTPDS